MLCQERQCLVTLPRCLQHDATQDLHRRVVGEIRGKLLHGAHGRGRLAGCVLRKGLDSCKLDTVFPVYLGDDIFRLTKSDSGAESEDARWEGVVRGQTAGVEVDYGLELSLHKGIGDVEELWNYQSVGCMGFLRCSRTALC